MLLFKFFNRVCQFVTAMFSVYTRADQAFAHSFLNIEEMSLFNQLPEFEKKHSVRVAKRMLRLVHGDPEIDYKKIAKLGLLHDIGKVAERNNTITKSILVLIRFFLPGYYNRLADKGPDNPKYRRYYVHKHHGAIGAELLTKIGESSDIIAIIKKHDPHLDPFGPEDPIELKILQMADAY